MLFYAKNDRAYVHLILVKFVRYVLCSVDVWNTMYKCKQNTYLLVYIYIPIAREM